jgi:hypothetical protein
VRAFEEVRTSLSRSAADRGLVIVLEDLHWANQATLTLLCQGAGRAGLLFVATYRSTERSAALRDALITLGRNGSTHLLLRAWSGDEVALAASAALPGWHPVLEQVGGGNPLFVVELLRALEQDGLSGQPPPADGSWPLGVPGNLAGITATRLARLSDEALEAVAVASVLGIECGHAEISELSTLDAEHALAGWRRRPLPGCWPGREQSQPGSGSRTRRYATPFTPNCRSGNGSACTGGRPRRSRRVTSPVNRSHTDCVPRSTRPAELSQSKYPERPRRRLDSWPRTVRW